MSDEQIKRKRGRPPKNQTNNESIASSPTSQKASNSDNNSFEFNSFFTSSGSLNFNSLFNCGIGIYDYFGKDEIECVFRDPIFYHDVAIRLSNFVYTKNGIVSNSIDYMTALPCLDRIVISKSKKETPTIKKNKELMKSTLELIDDKKFIRDALFTEMVNGIAFYYLDTKQHSVDRNKFMTDYDVENIVEINDLGINANIITLPWQYTKIVGKKNGRYVLAFNLRYFDDFTGETRERKLKKYPKEIVDGYDQRRKKITTGDWLVLDNDKTLCRKIKCKDSEPWGRSLIIAALSDVLYKDYFVDTKRNVLDEINSKIIYETFPEGKDKGSCALTKSQQENQHNTVKNAVMNKNGRKGINFFSVAAGTKLDSIDVSNDIFDSKYEPDLNSQISVDLGICASLIGAMETGSYAAGTNNLEMINAQIYTWVYEWQKELNHVINKNIIKNDRSKVEVYYFPTSFVNRKSFFDSMKSLYCEASGSLSFLIASTGVDVDAYFAVLDSEIADGIYDKYKPHETSYTLSKNGESGRPTTDSPTDNTVKSQNNNGNSLPSPSDNK